MDYGYYKVVINGETTIALYNERGKWELVGCQEEFESEDFDYISDKKINLNYLT